MEQGMEQSNMANNNNQLLFKAEDEYDSINNEVSSSLFDHDDFSLDTNIAGKEDDFDTANYGRETSFNNTSNASNNSNNNATWVQLLNLPPPQSSTHHHHHGVPVGGMRRVSSCYFSIASNISNCENNSAFHSPNPSYHNSSFNCNNASYHHFSSSSGNSVLSFEGRNASDFLLHDILMNVFSFLDANSLASFSETGRRPNFEVFYFLELQLQRALLMGEGNHFVGDDIGLDRVDGHEDVMEQAAADEVLEDDDGENASVVLEMEGHGVDIPLAQDWPNDDEAGEQNDDNESNLSDGNNEITATTRSSAIPSFEGSIAGTGVITRLSSLDNAMARKIVQTYLDSNTSRHGMPLSHSLAYFRQVLLRHHSSLPSPFRQKGSPAVNMNINIDNMDTMAKNARNMALFFTFVGAAYMRTQQGGDLPNMPAPPITMPDPSEVLNEENMEAFKNMMLFGLAGGFLKAGKTMKERQQQHGVADEPDQGNASITQSRESSSSRGFGTDSTTVNNSASGNANQLDNGPQSPSNHKRTSSIEELSHMVPRPSAIASRLYNAFSNTTSNNSLPNTYSDDNSGDDDSKDYTSEGGHNNTPLLKRKHRSKRSHTTIRQTESRPSEEVEELNYVSISEEKKFAEPGPSESISYAGEEEKTQAMENKTPLGIKQKSAEGEHSLEAMSYLIDHPFSPNPYEHPSCSTLNTAAMAVADNAKNPANNATSFFSFKTRQESPDSGNVPSGCIGDYAHAVKTAATEVTRLVKLERKTNFDSLPPDQQLELSMRFIDACTSDTKLHIVKEILQKHKNMDVDRFFIGPDDTETCALHACSFNGAEKVLQFLCGGIDECDPSRDCGLCDVNVKDANGWTALHFAAGANSVTSVRVLAENGANLTIEASNGYTPYHWAERLSNEEVSNELERLGADNRFVGRWMFGGTTSAANTPGGDRRAPVSFLANRFFAIH